MLNLKNKPKFDDLVKPSEYLDYGLTGVTSQRNFEQWSLGVFLIKKTLYRIAFQQNWLLQDQRRKPEKVQIFCLFFPHIQHNFKRLGFTAGWYSSTGHGSATKTLQLGLLVLAGPSQLYRLKPTFTASVTRNKPAGQPRESRLILMKENKLQH